MSDIDDRHVYRCRIKIRDFSPIGNAAIPAFREYLDGKEFILRPMWIGDEDDKYPDEWAMMFLLSDSTAMEADGHHMSWIASGDVEVLENLERKGNWSWEI